MHKKVIWLINQDASTPQTGMGGRHYYLAKELAKQGHKVYLIAGSYSHLLRQPPKLKKRYLVEPITDGFDFVWVNIPMYSGAHDKKRILSWFLFSWRLLGLSKFISNKPDVILASSPAPFLFLGAQRLAKKFKAKLAFEVRDIWPLTLVELGGYSVKHPFIRFMQWVEDKAYRESDFVISNLPNAVEHMVSRGMDGAKFSWIPNGIDLNEVSQIELLSSVVVDLIPKNKFLVGYTGTLGVANALEVLIDVADILKTDDSIGFVLVGRGKDKPALMDKVAKLGLKNVTFIDAIKKTQIQTLLKEMDVCFISAHNIALYHFGVAMNKLFEYLYSAKPVLYAIDSGAYKPVDEAKAGFSISTGNPEEIAKAILKLKSMTPQQRNVLGTNGRDYVLKNHDYAKLAKKLSEVLLK